MGKFIDVQNDYRFERKFRTNLATRQELIDRVLTNPALFREQFSGRQINSVYLDTVDRQFMADNLAGIASRRKPRFRWYGKNSIYADEPNLELKIKQNMLGRKERFKAKGFLLNSPTFRAELSSVVTDILFSNPHLEFLNVLEPTLLVTYFRRYFVSANGEYRVTIDSDLKFVSMSNRGLNGAMCYEPRGELIFEIKYGATASEQDRVLGSFGLRYSRCSKYVIGMLSV